MKNIFVENLLKNDFIFSGFIKLLNKVTINISPEKR
jgi:hypothetical protein